MDVDGGSSIVCQKKKSYDFVYPKIQTSSLSHNFAASAKTFQYKKILWIFEPNNTFVGETFSFNKLKDEIF